MPRIRELDGLRAIAALSVFAHHAIGFPAIARITGAGWIGVDLFFVISGYLITTILLGMRGTPHYFKNFYMRRTLRIFPPYYLFLLICFVVSLFSSDHFSGKLWSSFALYATSLVVILPWFNGALASVPSPASAIELTWSLSIEELFYLLWAPAVRFLGKRSLLWVVIGIIFFAPALRWYMHTPGQRAEYFFFPTRMDSLAFGALLALLWESARLWRISGWQLTAGLSAAGCALWLTGDPRSDVRFVVLGYSLIAAAMALLVAFVLQRAGTENLMCQALRSKRLVRVGTVSYMFYLLHLFVIRLSNSLFSTYLNSHWALSRTLAIGTSFAVTLLLAELSWRYFESPILRLKSRFSSERARDGAAQPSVVAA